MGLAIYLRRDVASNRFRDVIVRSLNSGLGTHGILCSGFFQENRGNYDASREPGFVRGARRLRELRTIGVYNQAWMGSYRAFCRHLRASHVRVRPFYKPGLRWHAKVFLLKRDGNPFLAVLGSSNITRPAFSDTAPFNWETDVVIWSDRPAPRRRRLEEIVLARPEPHSAVIVTEYDAARNGGLTIDDRLAGIAQELEDLSVREVRLK